MEKNFILNRRTVLGGAAALGTAGVLAACGSSKDSKATTQGATAGTDAKELYDIAETAVSDLKQGGTLRLSVTALGPDFNLFGTGVTSYTQAALSPMYYSGIWQANPMGKRTLSPEFAKSFDVSEENGVPVVSIELNPVAKFNDGTPIDYKALQATWNILKSVDGDYKIETSGIYSSVGSVERDGDDFKVKVTFAKPYYPLNILFGEILHPALLDKNLFNEGFVDNPHPEYAAGPFTVAEGGWNSSEKTLTLTRNDKWWGEKPVLERIVFRQMDSAAERAAFKNDEIDAAPATAAASYKELKEIANTEMRRGVRLFSGGMIMNPGKFIAAGVASLTQPLFAQGKLKGNYEIAKITQESAQLDFEKTLLKAGQEVSNALNAYNTACQTTDLAKQQVQQLQKAYDDTQFLFKNGNTTTYLETLNSQMSLLNGQLSLVNKRYEKVQAVISLYQALGGGRH